MIDLKPACRQMIDLLAAVNDDQLGHPTPCAEYTLGDLIEHVDEVSQGFAGFAGMNGSESNPADGHRVDVATHVQTLGEAWDDPQTWRGSTDAGGLELSNDLWGKIALTEMVVHGWDIAQTIQRAFDLPDDTFDACLDHVAEFVPNAPLPELWGPAVEPSPGASRLDRIVAITGRAPSQS